MKISKKRRLSLLSLFLAVLLSVAAFPFYVSANGPDPQTGAPLLSGEEELGPVPSYLADNSEIAAEEISGRGEFEKHYLLKDGSFLAVTYPEAVHYLDEDGRWQEVDNTLSLSDGKIKNGNSDFQVSFAEKALTRNTVSLLKDGRSFSWSLAVGKAGGISKILEETSTQTAEILNAKETDASALAVPGISGALRYSRPFSSSPEIAVEYSVFQNKVEEDVYILSPTDVRSFSMLVNAPGLSALPQSDGSVSFVDETGTLQYRVGVPYMSDAAYEVLNDIEVTVKQEGDVWIVTYTPEEEWLSSPDRVYPLLLDPSITTREYCSNITDTYVQEGNTANHSEEKNLYFGVKSGKVLRTYVKINNLPEIDPSMPIESAEATFRFMSGTTTGKTARMYRAGSSWDPATITFANAPSGGSLLSTVPYNSSLSTMTFDITADMEWKLKQGGTNYGYMIRYEDESNVNPDYNVFLATEISTASKRPVITVRYGYSLPDTLFSGGIYSFQNVGSGSFLTVHNSTDANDVNVYQYSTSISSLSSGQKFKLEYVSSTGGYVLRAMCSSNGTNRVLDIYKIDGYVESGSNVQIYSNNDSLAQHWFIVGCGNSEFRLIPRTKMSTALSAYPSSANGSSSGTSTTSPGNVFVSTYTGSAYQRWRIVENGAYIENELPTIQITGNENVYVDGSIQWTAITSPSGIPVTWTSSVPGVAAVDSSGTVRGIRAGTTVITASCTVPSTGEIATVSKELYVRILDGIYYIMNGNSYCYLTTNGCHDNLTKVTQESRYTSTETDMIRQMWRIQYIKGGKYVIRHYYNPNMALDRTGNNVDVYAVNPTDSEVLLSARWTIDDVGAYYELKNNNDESYYLQAQGQSKASGASAVVGPTTGNTASRWDLRKVEMFTSVPTGVYLYDTSAKKIVTSPTVYLAPGETKDLGRLYLKPVYYSPSTISQTFTWESRNTSCATVSSIGAVTGVSAGTTSITGRPASGSATIYVKFTVNITEIPNGECFIQNRYYRLFAQIDNDTAPNYSTVGAVIEQFPIDGGPYQRWQFTSLGDGYYKITSVQSGMALSVEPNNSLTDGADIVQRPYGGEWTQQWKITKTKSGGYKIKARSSEAYTAKDLVLDLNDKGLHFDDKGLNLKQREYLDNTSYKDEWNIYPFHDATLIAIHDPGHVNPYHDENLPSIHKSLEEMGYSSITELSDRYEGSYDGIDLMTYLCTSKILTLTAHGLATSVEMGNGVTLSFEELMELQGNSLSNLELVVLASCYTAEGYPHSNPPQNMAEALWDLGAKNVVAFKDKVACAQVMPWVDQFFQLLAMGNDYEQAMKSADDYVHSHCDAVPSDDGSGSIYTTDEIYRAFIH